MHMRFIIWKNLRLMQAVTLIMVCTIQSTISNSDKAPRAENLDLVRTYLREIGRTPLLTHEQEITYGKQVQQLMPLLKAKEALARKLNRAPTLKEWALHVHISETDLSAIAHRGQRAKQKMIEANLRLVVAIAKKYQH